MFNYKTWKLYYPLPKDPVVDGNGNSITPDSLKKNMTIPAEAPGNDLAKILANMLGADPANKVEAASELIKYLEPISNRAIPDYCSGGAFFVTDNNNTLDKTWAEISAASENSVVVLIRNGYGFGYLTHVIHTEDYSCTFMFPASDAHGELGISFRWYGTSAENDYPVHE